MNFQRSVIALGLVWVSALTAQPPQNPWENYWPSFWSEHGMTMGSGPRRPRPIRPVAKQVQGSAIRIKIQVPTAEAQVWMDGYLTRQQGTERNFVSPLLPSGNVYGYHIRIRWIEDGDAVEIAHMIHCRAGQEISIDFTR